MSAATEATDANRATEADPTVDHALVPALGVVVAEHPHDAGTG